MTNLKKVLVTVLALAMILSVPVSAGVNYPDVSADASYAEATDMLNYLSIMEGDDQGNFRPDANLTRAEATAIIVRAKGLDSAAEGAKGATAFADVAADHWATGYINLGQQSNIIAGYGDGNFGPEAPVLYEQAVKMVVAALGYTPMAEQNGGYPSGYLVVASQNQLTKGVSGAAQTPITRANMARLTYNALDVPTMEQISWKANEPEYGIMDGSNGGEKKTLLSHALEVDTYEGYITDTYLVSGADIEDKSITIDYTKKNGENYVGDETFDEAEGVDAASFFGQSVVIYVKANEETDKDEIIAIAPKATKNVSLVLDYSEITADTFDGKTMQYVADGTTTKVTVKLDGAAYYYNGRAEDGKKKEAQAFLAAPQAGFVELLDKDNDKVYDFVMVTQYEADYVVSAVEADTKQVIDKNEAAIADIDIDNENVITKFYTADGAVASFDDIAADDVLTLAISSDKKLVTVYISKVKVTGAVTEKRTNKAGNVLYTIDGNEYLAAGVTPEVGDEGAFFISVDNRIVYKDTTSVKSDNYAFLYDAAITTGIGGATVEAKFLTAKNEWITTKFATKVYTYEGASKDYIEFVKDGGIKGFVEVKATEDEKTKKTVYDVTVTPQLFQYEVNEAGLIDKVYTAAAKKNEDHFSIYEDTEDAYREKYGKLGKTAIDENTVIFSVKEAKDAAIASEESIKLADAKSLFIDEKDYTFVSYDAAEAAKVVVVYAVDTMILPETQILVVDKVSEVVDNGKTLTKIYGFQSGAEVSAIVTEEGIDVTGRDGKAIVVGKKDEKDVYMQAEDLETGDAIIFSLDADGKFDKIQLLMGKAEAETLMADNSKLTVNGNYGDDEDTWDMFGFAAKRNNGKLMLTDTKENWADVTKREESFLKDADSYDFELAVAANGVNVYEVALGGSETTVETIKASNIIVGVTKVDYDCHWAYVRMYDGEVVDVVVYRTTNEEAK